MTLEECCPQAAAQVESLRKVSEENPDPEASQKRRPAAQKRVAGERESRVNEAIKNLKELEEQREKRKKGSGDKARASTTDPEVRCMKMACGGFRPAYNVQFATAGNSRMIVSVDVTNNDGDGDGDGDGEQMPPLHKAVCQAYGKTPDHYLYAF